MIIYDGALHDGVTYDEAFYDGAICEAMMIIIKTVVMVKEKLRSLVLSSGIMQLI